MTKNLAEAERFWGKVDLDGPDGCWLWTASTDKDGYGQFGVGSQIDGTATMAKSHRWAHEHLVGPIPEGLQIDHLCRVRSCVNPGHLEPVTNRENLRRGHEARGTTAQHGSKSMYNYHGCRCRPCKDAHAAYNRERYARKRAEVAA